MENLEYIDDYFNGEMLPGQKKQFEERIEEDPAFAEEVAFYVSAREVAREQVVEEKKRRFSQLYQETSPVDVIRPMKSFWPYIASAAIILGIVAGLYLVVQAPSPEKLADRYIQQNFQTLGVTMTSVQDSVQSGLRLYNEGNLGQALQQFEAILRSNPADFTSLKYAGIVSLQLEEYDKAIFYFSKLEQNPGLFANPGKFYHALALMKRNKPGDQKLAKDLLQEVVESNLEEKETAQKWILQLQ